MMELLKFKKTISDDEISYLNKLLLINTPISTCLKLIEGNDNNKMIDDILSNLQTGKTIEECIQKYIPNKINDYLLPLSKTMSFSSALDLSISFYEESKNNEKRISNSIAYPLGLLFFSLTGLYLFDAYGIDSILGLLNTFNTDLSSFSFSRTIIRFFIYVVYFGSLIISGLLLFFTRKKRIAFLYVFLSKLLPNSLVQTYYSQEFISLLLICRKKGYKTKESLKILNSIKNVPIISFLAFHLNEMLLEGQEFDVAINNKYFDDKLTKYIKIGIHSNDFNEVLENYIELAKTKINKKTKELTLFIQLLTYLLIGIIIIFVYEVLFMPMQALASY